MLSSAIMDNSFYLVIIWPWRLFGDCILCIVNWNRKRKKENCCFHGYSLTHTFIYQCSFPFSISLFLFLFVPGELVLGIVARLFFSFPFWVVDILSCCSCGTLGMRKSLYKLSTFMIICDNIYVIYMRMIIFLTNLNVSWVEIPSSYFSTSSFFPPFPSFRFHVLDAFHRLYPCSKTI